MSNIDYLTEDNILPLDQKFVCLSFLTDKNLEKKCSMTGIKVRGVFSTYEAACEHAKTLQTIDTYFSVFVGEMGRWLPFDPDPDTVKESEYANEQLNNMMKSYAENQEKAKIFHEHRKSELMRKNVMENLNSRRENLKELNEQINQTDNQSEINKLKLNVTSVEDQIKIMDEKKEQLDKELEDLNNQIKLFSDSEIQFSENKFTSIPEEIKS
jgi:hypothetical protein